MEFWNKNYYKVSKFMASIVGQWPYQSVRELIFYRGILIIMAIIQLTPRLRAVILHSDDPELILAAIAPFIIDGMVFIKTITNYYNFKKMKFLLDNVKHNSTILTIDESKILDQHSEMGRRVSKIYIGAVCGGVAIFVTEPIQLRLLYTIIKTNRTIAKFAIPVDYGSIDVDEYYYGLLFLSEISTSLIIIAMVACDLLFFICAYHVCGLFDVVGYIIENIPVDLDDASSDEGFIHAKRSIQIHLRAIEMAKTLEDVYVWNFFGVMGLNMMLTSITGVQLVVNLDNMERTVQYTASTFSTLAHLFVECLLGQRVIDYSLGIQEHISSAKWYNSSIKSKKLIILLLIRSQRSSELTAGKMLVMNMETFCLIIRTSASYFTILLATL